MPKESLIGVTNDVASDLTHVSNDEEIEEKGASEIEGIKVNKRRRGKRNNQQIQTSGMAERQLRCYTSSSNETRYAVKDFEVIDFPSPQSWVWNHFKLLTDKEMSKSYSSCNICRQDAIASN